MEGMEEHRGMGREGGVRTARQRRSLCEGMVGGDTADAAWGPMVRGFEGHTGMGNREPRRKFLRRGIT